MSYKKLWALAVVPLLVLGMTLSAYGQYAADFKTLPNGDTYTGMVLKFRNLNTPADSTNLLTTESDTTTTQFYVWGADVIGLTIETNSVLNQDSVVVQIQGAYRGASKWATPTAICTLVTASVDTLIPLYSTAGANGISAANFNFYRNARMIVKHLNAAATDQVTIRAYADVFWKSR